MPQTPNHDGKHRFVFYDSARRRRGGADRVLHHASCIDTDTPPARLTARCWPRMARARRFISPHRVDAGTGAPTPVARVANGTGATWIETRARRGDA